MTTPEAVSYRPRSVPLGTRLLVRLAVGLALVLARQSPGRIRRLLLHLRRGAAPATEAQAAAARRAVVAVSLTCSGREGCLPRSLATVLLCRLRGHWPTWCIGVRRVPPFGAHAWVAVDDTPVGEDYPVGYFNRLMSVPPTSEQA